MKHNGVILGPQSPLLTASGARRLLARTEEDDQIALMELLVGRARKGQDRMPGDGLTGKYPELELLYAIPNGGKGARKAFFGRMKAMGLLRGMCDLCLPCARGPFIGLYCEMKREGQTSRPEQRHIQARLRDEGHCVVECVGVERARDVIIGYLEIPKNRPSARPITNSPVFHGPLVERIEQWRKLCYVALTGEAVSR